MSGDPRLSPQFNISSSNISVTPPPLQNGPIFLNVVVTSDLVHYTEIIAKVHEQRRTRRDAVICPRASPLVPEQIQRGPLFIAARVSGGVYSDRCHGGILDREPVA